jgi:hypothetical protein
MATFRKQSQDNWQQSLGPDGAIDQINAGSFQRMADALELIAKDRQKLINDKEYYQASAKRYQERYYNEQRRVAALKGVITKLRKKL